VSQNFLASPQRQQGFLSPLLALRAGKEGDYSLGGEGGGVDSLRRIGLACAACVWPSTGGFVTNIGSGTVFC
jgi:hypothetical protein